MDGKLYQRSVIRPAGGRILKRPRLNEIFKQGLEKQVVYVMAGAGYGKTQGVSSFLDSIDTRCIWLNLCDLDNLPSRFWEGFVYGVSQEDSDFGACLSLLEFPNTFEKYNRFMNLFSQYIYSGKHLAVVFDGIHSLTEPDVFTFIRRIIEAQLENFSIFLLSRQGDLPMLFGEGGMISAVIIGPGELMFSLEETKALLRLWEIDAKENMAMEIWRQTEGWPLLIPLLGSTMRSGGSITGNSLPALKRVLHQLFEAEVFSAYSLAIKKLLIKLSLLEMFGVDMIESLADGLTDEMELILKQNIFIRYNSHLKAYVFHNLYKVFLAEKMDLLETAELNAVYEQVAGSFEARQLYMDALRYYRYCGHHENIWRILQRVALDCPVESGEFYLQLIAEMPAEFKAREYMVHVVEARLLLNSGKIFECEQMIKSIIAYCNERPGNEGLKSVLGEAYLIEGWLKLIYRDYSYEESFRNGVLYIPGGSRFVSPDTLSMNACYAIAPASAKKGELDRFVKLYIRTLPNYIQLLKGCGHGQAYLVQAEAAYYRNDMESAIIFGTKALQCGREKQQDDIVALAYNILLFASVANGSYKDVVSYLQAMERDVAKDGKAGWVRDIVEGSLYGKLGRIDLVPDWIKTEGINSISIPINDDGRNQYIRGYCYLEEGRYPELSAYIEYLETVYEKRPVNSLPMLINFRLLKALAYFKLDQYENAVLAFESAYELAYENDLIMFFIEYGNYMRALINSFRRFKGVRVPDNWLDNVYSKSATYAKKLSQLRSQLDSRKEEDGLYGALTEREKEILLCLSQGLTREEIAAEKAISINTVKSDLRTIYNKLGAINRKDAIRIAAIKRIL